ncbi:EAL domain-containing protein [Metabacillus sp. RGM 3146]|uniref:sensor domain-containing protein n=1 Tax=Metabacillus sp. RGM 3146 TaxID=3401092 RepID=UPI003B9B76EB
MLAEICDSDKIKKKDIEWEKSFHYLYSHHPDAILLLNNKGMIEHANEAALNLFQMSLAGLHSLPFYELFHPADQKALSLYLVHSLANKMPYVSEIKTSGINSQMRECRAVFMPVEKENLPDEVFLILQDVTDFKRVQDQIKHIAYFDELTSLPNYRAVSRQLNELVERPEQDKKSAAVIKVNIDRFKYFNEVYGKHISDCLLREIAEELKNTVPEQYFIGRFHNDEFVVIVHQLDDRGCFYNIANELAKQFKRKYEIKEQTYQVEISIGAAFFPEHGRDAESLLKNSEIALKIGKEDNGLKEYNVEKSHAFQRRYLLQKELYQAMHRGQLMLYYQPQIDTAKNNIFGMEVLLRWQHPELGFVSPAEFIPIAEETGLIIEIGRWSMEQACSQLKKWHESGNIELRMSINLSVKQFFQPDLVSMVSNILKKYNISPYCFEIEFTESLSMHYSENFIKTVENLKKINIHLSVDDFGTGYSSLSYLTQLPLDKIKIDRSFVKKMLSSKQDEIVIKTIIGLAKNLGMQIIAEGVEEECQASFLEEHGCHQMQGYFFSKPVPAEKMDILIKGFSEKK